MCHREHPREISPDSILLFRRPGPFSGSPPPHSSLGCDLSFLDKSHDRASMDREFPGRVISPFRQAPLPRSHFFRSHLRIPVTKPKSRAVKIHAPLLTQHPGPKPRILPPSPSQIHSGLKAQNSPAAGSAPGTHSRGGQFFDGGLRAKWNPSYERNAVTTSATTLAHNGTETPCTTTGNPKMTRARWQSAIRRNMIPAVSENVCSLKPGTSFRNPVYLPARTLASSQPRFILAQSILCRASERPPDKPLRGRPGAWWYNTAARSKKRRVCGVSENPKRSPSR